MSYATATSPQARDVQRRKANLEVDRRCLAAVEARAAGAPGYSSYSADTRDLFGRTAEQLREHINFEERALKIAMSV